MARGKDAHGDLVYTCTGCDTELEVDNLGLVFDIREETHDASDFGPEQEAALL